LSKLIDQGKSILSYFKYAKNKATIQTEKKMWWDSLCRQISPDIYNILTNRLEIDDFLVECIIVGKPQGTTEGWPPETAYSFQKKLMDTTLKGCIIQVTETLVPIPTQEAQALIDSAIYFNRTNQHNAMKSNELRVPNEDLELDYKDMKETVANLHYNKEKMFHGNFIITIWAENENAMKEAKSHVKGVLNENRILGELPLRRMQDAFLSAQPYPEVSDFTTIEMFSGFASLISPTISHISPLAGGSDGIYLGDEINTGKEVVIDFWSEPAPHVLIAGATGGGKTYALILIMIRLYIDAGRKVMYLTKKPDPKTNYRAVAEYFGNDGAIIEIGPGKHNINPLQIIYDSSAGDLDELQASTIFDKHKELFTAFLREWFRQDYSPNMDSYVDMTLNKLYESKGIKRTDAKTWKNKFPVMSELYNYWIEDQKTLTGKRKGTCQALIDKSFKIAKGGAFDYINNLTDADFSKGFTIIDIVNVPESLREPMNVLITGIISSQVATNSERGLTIVIDEGGAFLRDERLADMLFVGATQWRSQNTQLIFALHEFDDLQKANLSSTFMSNMFFKIVFGANMDESVVPFVQKALHLKESAIKDLMRLKRGECLLKIRNSTVAIAITASDKEDAIIKGQYSKQIEEEKAEEQIIEVNRPAYIIKDIYKDLVKDQNIILESWIDGEFSKKALMDSGYKYYNLQRVLDSGTNNVWIHQSIVGDKLVHKNQTPDHYYTVIQMAAYFTEKAATLKDVEITDIEINHHNDVDMSLKINGISQAFEYERNGTHTTVEQIQEKYNRAKITYDNVLFVCVSTNKKLMTNAIDDNWCSRGPTLKDRLDLIIENAQTRVTDRDFQTKKVITSNLETDAEDFELENEEDDENTLLNLESERFSCVFEENGAF